MGRRIHPRPRREKRYHGGLTPKSDTERRVLEAMSRFEHRSKEFMRIWANEFMDLQHADGFDTTFHTTEVHGLFGTQKIQLARL